MTVVIKAVFACTFLILAVSCGQLMSINNENKINYNNHYTTELLGHHDLSRKDEIKKISIWLNDAIQLGNYISNKTMQPIYDLNGASRLTKSDAAIVMETDTLPRLRRTAYLFGDTLTVNDAIAKEGTSREKHTPNSEHFSGRAIDISIKNMSNQEKIRLFESALKAGFTGFGFGTNILHVDTGRTRWWAYGNSTYGGILVFELGAIVKNSKLSESNTN